MNPLDQGRVGEVEQQGADEQEADASQRQPQAPEVHVDEHQGGASECNHEEDIEGKKLGVHVRIARPEGDPAGGVQQVEGLDAVVERLHHQDQPQQHREVGLHVRSEGGQAAQNANRLVEVVGGRGDQEDDDENRVRPLLQVLPERQPEHVEADVSVEDRVCLPEGPPVAKEQVAVPLARRLLRHPVGGHHRDDDQRQI